jgi:hypothetical protein
MKLSLPLEYDTDRPLLDDVQLIGSVDCTAYGICDVAEDFTGKEYDIQDLFNRIPSNGKGSDPLVAIAETIKNGLLPIGGTKREIVFTHGDIKAHIGEYDAFDNVRTKMMISKIPVLMWGPVYRNWLGDVVPIGDIVTNYHCVDAESWKWKQVSESMIDGEVMLVMEFWTGRKYYFSREVFNWWVKQYGFDSRILTDDATDLLFKKDFLTTIVRLATNLLGLLSKKKVI